MSVHASSPLFLILALCASGCSLSGDDGEKVEIYEGHYAIGFEDHIFQPCQADSPWSITAAEPETLEGLNQLYLDLLPDITPPAYARLRGLRSDKGTYGHLGEYEYELDVTEVLEVRGATSDDCFLAD